MSSENNIDHSHSLHHRQHHLHHRQRRRGRMRQQQQPKQQIQRRISVGVGRRQCQSVNRLMATRSIGRVRLRTALLWLALSVIIVVQTLSTNSIPSLQWHHSSGHAHRQHQAAVTGAHLDTIHTNNATKISPEDDRGDHHHHHHEQLLDSTSQSKQAPAWQRISVAAADELLGSAQPEDQQQQDGAFMEQSNELTTANNNGPIGERPESSQRIVAVSRASSLEGAGLDSSETVPSDEGEEENKKRRKNSDLTRAQDDGREDDDDGDEAVDKEETLGDAYVSGDLLHGPARTSKSIAHEPVVARAAKRPRAKTTTTQADAMGGGNTNELGESPVQDEEEEAEAGDGEEGADNGGAEQDEEEAADELEAQEDEEEATATATTKEQLRPGAGDEEDDEQDEPEELAESEEPSAASKDGRENELELPAGGYQTTGSVTRPELDLDVPVSRRMMTTTSMTTTTRKTQQRPSWLSSPASSSLGARRQPPAELATRISLSSSSSSSSSSAAAVASRLDGGAAQIVDSKAAQWRKLKRLNRKIAASTATTTTSTTITTTTTISPPSVEEQTDHHHQDRTPKSRELGSQTDESGGGVGVGERQFRPRLAQFYLGRIKENERLVSVTPKLRVENGAEICDFELRPLTASSSEASSTIAASNRQAGGSKTSALDEQPAEEDPRQLPFFVSWIDRIQGEVTIEANDLTQINCERQQNYTMRARAIGCNGLESNEALLRIELEDVNEFRPEFERAHYSVSVDVARVLAAATTNRLLRTTKTTGGSRREQAGQMSRDQVDNTNTEHSDTNWDNNRNQHRNQDVEEEDEEETKWAGLGNNNELGVSRGSPFSGAPDAWCHLLTVRAHDQDCSREFGEICRYELAEQTAGSGLASITETSSSSSGAGDQEQVSRGDQQGNAGSAGSGTSAHIRIDSRGNLRADCGWLWNQAQSRNQQNASVGAQQQQAPPPTAHTLTLQVVAFDCGGRKSRAPATVHVELLAQSRRETSSISNQHQASQQTTAPNGAAHCEPGWKDVDTQIAYGPSSGERWPFQQARLELCSVKCHRPNITVKLQLEATPTTLGDRAGRARPSSLAAVGARQQNGNGATRMPAPPSSYATTGGHSAAAPVFHCDRDPYAMVSKRRLCGARRKTIELLPPLDRHTSWTGSLFVGNSHHNRRDRNQNDLGGPEASQSAPRWPWTEAGQPEDLDMDSGALMQDGTDNESAGHQRITTSSRPTAANDDEENLGAYLPDGSYGRLASEFAARNRKGSPLAHSTGSTTTTTMKLGETRAGRGHAGSSQQEAHHEAAVSSRSGRVGEPTAGPAGGSSSMGGGASSARGGVVYRDQVYHFDGIDDALVVPSSIYTSSSSSQLDSQQTANEDSSGGNLLFGTRHTISFWMRHSEFKFKFERRQRRTNDSYGPMETNGSDARGENQDVDVDVDVNDDEDQLAKLSRHVQEHVLCVSERLASRRTSSNGSSSQATFGHSLDEHHHRDSHHHHHQNHYAIYLKNCKLNLLIRNGQQPRNTAGGGNREPVEWRWSLDERGGQFCDNKWHLYTLNVNYPSQVELFVDGQQFNNEKRLTTSSSEWSHTTTTTTKSSQMALAVGACYEARTRSMVGHFRGSLSGLSLVMNTNDDTSSIECLGRCTESLVSMAPQNDQQQMQEQQPLLQLQESRQDNSLVAYQESQDRIQLQGHDLVDIEEALAQIAYVNRRQLPSVGRRTIELTTQLSCQQQSGIGEPAAAPSTQLAIEPLAIRIDVLPSTSLPAISLTGTPNLAREHLPFIQGRVAPFESLSLQVKQLNLLGASDNGGSSSSWEHAAAQGRTKRPLSWAKNSNHHHQRSHHHHNHHHHHHQRTSNRGGGDEAAPSDLLDYIDDATASARAAAAAAVATGNTMASVASSGGANDSRPPPTPTRWTDSMGINLEASENLAAARRRIEACHVQVIGTGSELASQLDESNESLVLPIEQLTKLALYWRQSKWGALIYGLDTAENYETLLRLILYKNLRPDLTSERLFRLTCSDMSGRLLSNEYVQRLTMIHPGPSLSSSLQETGPSMDNGGAFAADQSAAFMNASSQLIVLSGPADDRRYDSLRSQQTRPERILLEPTDEQLGSRSITGEPMDDSMATVATASQRQQQLQLDSKFNTIAVAIMVLLVSAVLIILVIALANMKGANEYDEYSRHERRVRRRARREARLARRARRQQTSGMIRRRRQQTSSSCLSIDEDLGGSDCDEQQQQRELQQREPVLHLSSRIRNDELLVNNGACSYGGCDNDHAAADADSLRGSISSSASDEDYEDDDDDDGLTSGASSDSCDDTTPQPKAVSEYNYQPAARRQAGATIPLGRLARAPIQSHNCRGGGNCVSRHHEGDTITAQSSIEMDSLSWDDEIRRTGTGTEVATRAARRTRARDRAADHHQRTAGARGDGNTIVVMNPILHGDSDTATKLNSTTSVYQFKNGKRPLMASIRRPNASERPQSHLIQVLDLAQTRAHAADDDEEEEATRASRGPLERTSKTMLIDELIPMDESFCDSRSRSCSGSSNGDEEDEDDDEEDELSRSCSELSDDGLDREGLRGRSSPGSHLAWFDSEVDHEDQLEQQQHNRHLHNHHHHHHLMQQQARCNGRQHLLAGGRQHEPDCPVIRGAGCCDEGRTDDGGETTATELEDIDELEEAKTGNRCSTSTRGKLDTTISYEVYHDHHHQCLRAQRGRQQSTHQQRQQEQKLNITTTTDRLTG